MAERVLGPIVGVDLGGTNVTAARVGPGFVLGELFTTETRAAEGPAAVLDRIAAVVARAAGDAPPASVGIGSPGPVDYVAGTVSHPPNLPGWGVVDLAGELARRLGLDRTAVRVENDANAFALGEARIGAGVGRRSLLAVTLGTGIGGAFVLDGEVLRGATGVAGEIGHTRLRERGPRCGCGRLGCLETFASATALVRRAREAGASADLDARAIVEGARAGDAGLRRVVTEVALDLGDGLVDAIHLLDPEIIVIGGGLRHAGDLLLEPIRDRIRTEALPPARGVAVVVSELGPRAAIVGAAGRR